MEVKVFRRVSSTAQSAAEIRLACERLLMAGLESAENGVVALGEAMQNWALLFTQKTSRQHAVTPRSGGNFEKAVAVPGMRDGAEEEEGG